MDNVCHKSFASHGDVPFYMFLDVSVMDKTDKKKISYRKKNSEHDRIDSYCILHKLFDKLHIVY